MTDHETGETGMILTEYCKARLAERSLRVEWIKRILDNPYQVERQPCGGYDTGDTLRNWEDTCVL